MTQKNNELITSFLFLLFCSILPVVSFLKSNVHEIFLEPIRGLLYVTILFGIMSVLVYVFKLLFKRLSFLQLSFSVGVSGSLLFYLFAFNGFMRELLEEAYRFRIFLGSALFLILSAFLASYYVSKFLHVRKFFFAFIACFMIIEGIPVLKYAGYETPERSFKSSVDATFENVYYIIPDAMQGPLAYQRFLGKPLALVNELEERGFLINQPAYANGPVTIISLAHVFNMNYLLEPNQKISPKKYHDMGEIFKGNNPVYKAFHQLGYTITHVADGYVSHCSKYDDVCLDKKSKITSQDVIFADRTQLITAISYFKSMKNPMDFHDLRYPQAQEVEDVLPRLNIQPKNSQFTILHFSLPHYPYRFKADCTTYNGDAKAQGKNLLHVYDEQLQCSSKKIANLVDIILEQDPTAIILVQSDHGTITHAQGFKPLKNITEEDILENFNIVSAYKLPKQCEDYINPGHTSPVNSFRVILGCLNHQKPELLEHQSVLAYYLDWPTANEPVQFINPQDLFSTQGA